MCLQGAAELATQLAPTSALQHAVRLLSVHDAAPAERGRAVRALARAATAAAIAAGAGSADEADAVDDGSGVATSVADLADGEAWTVRAVHLVVATEGLLPAFARSRFYRSVAWTLLRHGMGTLKQQGASTSLALGIASMAAAGDVWEVRPLPPFLFPAALHAVARWPLSDPTPRAPRGKRALVLRTYCPARHPLLCGTGRRRPHVC